MRIALLTLLLASATSPADEPRMTRELWGQERVQEALQLDSPRFLRVRLSPIPAINPHVCGYIGIPYPLWPTLIYRAFVVNGTTGNVFLEEDTLQFTNIWNRVCGGQ